MKCESNFKVNAVGDHGLAYGPAQFHEATFYRIKQDALNAGQPYFFLEYKNASDQETLLNWALKHGYGREWTCYRKLQ